MRRGCARGAHSTPIQPPHLLPSPPTSVSRSSRPVCRSRTDACTFCLSSLVLPASSPSKAAAAFRLSDAACAMSTPLVMAAICSMTALSPVSTAWSARTALRGQTDCRGVGAASGSEAAGGAAVKAVEGSSSCPFRHTIPCHASIPTLQAGAPAGGQNQAAGGGPTLAAVGAGAAGAHGGERPPGAVPGEPPPAAESVSAERTWFAACLLGPTLCLAARNYFNALTTTGSRCKPSQGRTLSTRHPGHAVTRALASTPSMVHENRALQPSGSNSAAQHTRMAWRPAVAWPAHLVSCLEEALQPSITHQTHSINPMIASYC